MVCVECLLDLLHAVYVRDSVCVQTVLPDILHTAGSTSSTLRSGRGARGGGGETVVSFLQLQMQQPGGLETPGENVSQHALQLLPCQHECAFAA
jgi:hypothetical protein